MNAINIKAYTNDKSQIEAIKAMLNAFKIKFKIGTDKTYNPEFVAKILDGEQEFENGNFKTINTEDIWK